jgi:hypothetical protein
MAAGDASRTWFSEMVETLRQEWTSEMSWEQVFALRDRLNSCYTKSDFPGASGVRTMWCPVCNQRTQQAEPSVSVRALIFALGRFGIVGAVEMKTLEKHWAKHRKDNDLDRNGTPNPALSIGSDSQGPNHHSHGPTS